MFSFLDLGFTAGMMDAAGKSHSYQTLDYWLFFKKASKYILMIGVCLSGVFLILTQFEFFRKIFIHGSNYTMPIFFTLPVGILLYALLRICSLAYPALFAFGNSTTAFILQTFTSVSGLVSVILLEHFKLNQLLLELFILLPVSTQLIPGCIALLIVHRRTSSFEGTNSPIRLSSHATPMFIAMILTPLIPFFERTLILRIGTPSELGFYSIIRQVTSPFSTILESARSLMWGQEMRDRTGLERNREYWINRFANAFFTSFAIGVVSFFSCLVLIPIVDKKGQVTHINLTFTFLISMSIFLAFLYLPASTFLTTPAGLKLQLIFVVANLSLELVIGTFLFRAIGLPGLALGIVLSLLISTTIPGWCSIFQRFRD
ncbi:MAG: hypothetical protein WCO08_02205 [Actinomycetes bacterium]